MFRLALIGCCIGALALTSLAPANQPRPGAWRLEAGDWKLEAGGQKVEAGDPSRRAQEAPVRDSAFRHADTDADGTLSIEEFLDWQKVLFKKLDRDGDASLTPKEFTRGQGLGRKIAGAFAARTLKKMDSDADTAISPDEWQGSPRGFHRADKNLDGVVDLKELSQIGRILGQRLGRRASALRDRTRLLKRIDTDGDRAITRDEFESRRQAPFNKLDRNGDGILDKDDLRRRQR